MDHLEEFDNQETGSVKQVSIKWGLISGITSIVFFLIFVFTDSYGDSKTNWIGSIPFIIFMVLAHKEFKKTGNGTMTYSQGLGIGTLMALFSYLISGIFTYIYTKFINPDFYSMMNDKLIEQWQEQGLSQEQIDAALSMTSKFQNPEIALVMGLVGAVLVGFIIALIVSAITKQNPDFK